MTPIVRHRHGGVGSVCEESVQGIAFSRCIALNKQRNYSRKNK